MNNKILVELLLPAAEQTYDVYLPPESLTSAVQKLLSSIFNELADGKFKPTGAEILCDAETGAIYDMNMTVAELGLKNGSRIMLI
jgi:hypothetical protein